MYVKIKGVSASIYRSFLKRFLIVSLAIIVSFTTVCKPKDTDAGILLTTSIIVGIIAAATGSVWTTTQIIDWFNDKKGMSEDEMEDYFSAEISVDGDGNYTFTDDAQLTINQMLSDYNDSVTMTYRYPVQVLNISSETFPNHTVYQALLDLCLAYPDCYVFTRNEYKANHRGEPYVDLYGNAKELPYDSTSDNFYEFNVIPVPFAGVTQYMDLYSASTSYYNDNWEKSFTPKNFFFTTDGRVFTYCNEPLKVGSTNYGAYFKQIEPGTFPDLSDLGSMNYWSWYGTSYAMYLDNKRVASLSARTVYSANVGALNVYKSEADMKKDIGSQFIGSYTDTYTGTPNYNITTSEVNNIVNNYYPSDDGSGGGSGSGSGSGSDDSGGGSSGGVFDDIISGIASGVGSIIKGIFSIVKELVDAVADAIASITKSITDLSSLLKTDFTDFLSAVFPFLPQEFITILIAGLSLFLFGVTIKILRG